MITTINEFRKILEASNIISGATNLRKLTKKSTLKFGKWAQLSIENLIKMESNYLRWIYFDCSNIDFMDDVLTEIGITDEYKIKKPGKNPELYKVLEAEIKKSGIKKKDISFIYNLNGHNNAKVSSTMDKENTNKVTADTETAYTMNKFGKLDGGRASKTEPKIK